MWASGKMAEGMLAKARPAKERDRQQRFEVATKCLNSISWFAPIGGFPVGRIPDGLTAKTAAVAIIVIRYPRPTRTRRQATFDSKIFVFCELHFQSNVGSWPLTATAVLSRTIDDYNADRLFIWIALSQLISCWSGLCKHSWKRWNWRITLKSRQWQGNTHRNKVWKIQLQYSSKIRRNVNSHTNPG